MSRTEFFRAEALNGWNFNQPAWTAIKRYDQLTPAQQSIVDERAEQLEFAALFAEVAESVRKMDC